MTIPHRVSTASVRHVFSTDTSFQPLRWGNPCLMGHTPTYAAHRDPRELPPHRRQVRPSAALRPNAVDPSGRYTCARACVCGQPWWHPPCGGFVCEAAASPETPRIKHTPSDVRSPCAGTPHPIGAAPADRMPSPARRGAGPTSCPHAAGGPRRRAKIPLREPQHAQRGPGASQQWARASGAGGLPCTRIACSLWRVGIDGAGGVPGSLCVLLGLVLRRVGFPLWRVELV